MIIRIFAIALLVSAISSPLNAQGGAGGGAGGSSGAAGGAPGSAPSGTAGTSPSASSPTVGTPGVPGPTNGVGLPGGPGPGNTTAAPNQPAASPSAAAVGRPSTDAGAAITTTNTAQGGGSPNSSKSRTNAKSREMQSTSVAAAEFHPEAVIDKSLDQASADIAAMSSAELRQLVALFDQCTAKQHPAERAGTCAAASKRYKSEFGKDRAVDRALLELERIVRFQRMFGTANAATQYADNINTRLRGAARLASDSTDKTAQVSLKRQGARQ